MKPIYRSNGHRDYVSVTSDDLKEAAEWGKFIYDLSHADGRKDRIGNFPGHWLRKQQLGALAELSVAKALGVPWPKRVNQSRTVPDIDPDIEVRLIGVDRYGLRVKEKDLDDWRVVGIVIEKGRERFPYRLPGWCYAGEARRPEWLMNPYDGVPFWAVPQDALRPFSLLRSDLDKHEQQSLFDMPMLRADAR